MTVAEARAQLAQRIRDFSMLRSRYAMVQIPEAAAAMSRAGVEVINAVDQLVACVRAEAVASPVGHLSEMRDRFDAEVEA